MTRFTKRYESPDVAFHGESNGAAFARSIGLLPIDEAARKFGLTQKAIRYYFTRGGCRYWEPEWHHVERNGKIVKRDFVLVDDETAQAIRDGETV